MKAKKKKTEEKVAKEIPIEKQKQRLERKIEWWNFISLPITSLFTLIAVFYLDFWSVVIFAILIDLFVSIVRYFWISDFFVFNLIPGNKILLGIAGVIIGVHFCLKDMWLIGIYCLLYPLVISALLHLIAVNSVDLIVYLSAGRSHFSITLDKFSNSQEIAKLGLNDIFRYKEKVHGNEKFRLAFALTGMLFIWLSLLFTIGALPSVPKVFLQFYNGIYSTISLTVGLVFIIISFYSKAKKS